MKARILIVLALACVSMSALATGASASQLKAEKYPAKVTGGTGDLTFTFEESLYTKCSGDFYADLAAPTEALTASSVFQGCVFWGLITSIEMNGCHWQFDTGAGGGDQFAGTMGILCPTGKGIRAAGAGCEILIPTQTGLGPVSYENLTTATPKPKVTATVSATGVTYNRVKDGLFCPLSGTGSVSDGTLSLTAIFSAQEKEGAKSPVGLKVE